MLVWIVQVILRDVTPFVPIGAVKTRISLLGTSRRSLRPCSAHARELIWEFHIIDELERSRSASRLHSGARKIWSAVTLVEVYVVSPDYGGKVGLEDLELET